MRSAPPLEWLAARRWFVGCSRRAADKPVIDTGDTAWLLIAMALVLMMNIPGLALFYAGMVRKKNVLATAGQAFAVAALVTVPRQCIARQGRIRPRDPGLAEAFEDRSELHRLHGGWC